MRKVILKASIGIHEGFPTIVLQDEMHTTLIGDVLYNSITSLAREYQKDFEYNKKGRFEYFVIVEGTGKEIKLFQKPVIGNYGEDPVYIDETNKI